MPEFMKISYEEFEKDCRKLAENIRRRDRKITRMVAVARGGLVPACLLSQYLDIREIHAISLASYTGIDRCSEMRVISSPAIEDGPENLFVDDLIDSGKTLEYLRKAFPKSCMAAVYAKNPRLRPDIFAKETDPEVWIIFPWEKDPL
jgi:xanthine phosphoribosyltransferase